LGLAAYDVSKVKGYRYDPAMARVLVFKAGYDGGKAMPPVKLLCVSTGEVLTNFIVNELKQSNINATLETVQDSAEGNDGEGE
jgi:peptide/nickel transport system substrate-binding protein